MPETVLSDKRDFVYKVGMKHLWLLLAALFLSPAPALAESPKTLIEDQAEAELLLGRHLFTSSNLATSDLFSDYVNFGEATIYKQGENFFIEADHSCYQRIPRYPQGIEGGYVRLKGKIVTIKKDEFTFRGRLSGYKRPPYNAGRTEPFDCSLEETFTFSRKTHPEYWRLQLAQSSLYYERPENRHKICLQFFDSPDIFSTPLEGNAPHKCVRTLEEAKKIPMPHKN